LVLIRQIASEIGRAAAVLAMIFLCFAAAPADLSGPDSIAQQAAATAALQSFCGGHGQPQLACHAPNACCRPDQALLPPHTQLPEAAYGRVSDVAYTVAVPQAADPPSPRAFRSRAPPV
jgi:hypothetical protein